MCVCVCRGGGGYLPDYICEGDVFRIIYLKEDMFCIILDIYLKWIF